MKNQKQDFQCKLNRMKLKFKLFLICVLVLLQYCFTHLGFLLLLKIDNELAKQSLQVETKQLNYLKDTSPALILPWHEDGMMLSTEALLESAWVADLQSFLRTEVNTAQPVSLVTSDSVFQEVLLNWLISATLGIPNPLENMLVISLNTSLHEVLISRGIASLNVPPSMLVNLSDVISAKVDRKYVEAVRVIVMRLINHWGFDVAMYDTDAIILNDPNELYQMYSSSDVIAAIGHTPTYLYNAWGVTLCMGVVMMRSNHRTEVLWEKMHLVEVPDDQTKANKALRSMNITWQFQNNSANSQRRMWHTQGSTYPDKLTVTLLKSDIFCRELECDMSRKTEYYVWHQGGMHSLTLLIKRAKTAGVWLLRDNWKEVSKTNGKLQGLEWLNSIANLHPTVSTDFVLNI